MLQATLNEVLSAAKLRDEFGAPINKQITAAVLKACERNKFILILREKRWPSGRRGVAARAAVRASHDSHFSIFAEVLWGRFLVYCMDVQL
jgi:hypothetical protein